MITLPVAMTTCQRNFQREAMMTVEDEANAARTRSEKTARGEWVERWKDVIAAEPGAAGRVAPP